MHGPRAAGIVAAMRRLSLAIALVLAGCATAPQQPEAPAASTTPVHQTPGAGTQLVGLTAAELVGHFGNPALQVREGQGLKLQFRGRLCVLDAYLYPPQTGSGPPRVVHVDTRLPSGMDTAQAACISALETPS